MKVLIYIHSSNNKNITRARANNTPRLGCQPLAWDVRDAGGVHVAQRSPGRGVAQGEGLCKTTESPQVRALHVIRIDDDLYQWMTV